jgi:dynein heavy chain 1, cytosolic
VGAWGCFDEFNRLEERILSAVSQQILTIQRGLQLRQPRIDFLGRSIRLDPALGIFVTMNPGYAGRSNLPDNLKQLFRAVAMVVPDRRLIAQVMLFSQGIATAEALAGRVVLLFQLCQEQLSAQAHYDFGLRALKSVLVRAGALKRAAMLAATATTATAAAGVSADANAELERDVLLKSACSTMLPKLVSEDCVLFGALLAGVFPGCSVGRVEEAGVRIALTLLCFVLYIHYCALLY